MSKERLEEIKQQLEESNSYEGNPNGYWYHNINWLIEQAERVQMLENKLSEVCETEFLVGIENEKLKQQNKIYRKALELYAISGQAVGEVKHGEEARKALEESE